MVERLTKEVTRLRAEAEGSAREADALRRALDTLIVPLPPIFSTTGAEGGLAAGASAGTGEGGGEGGGSVPFQDTISFLLYSADPEATILYTTDGSEPCPGPGSVPSQLGRSPMRVQLQQSAVVRAVCVARGRVSPVAQCAFSSVGSRRRRFDAEAPTRSAASEPAGCTAAHSRRRQRRRQRRAWARRGPGPAAGAGPRPRAWAIRNGPCG